MADMIEGQRMVWSVRGGVPWHTKGHGIDDNEIYDIDASMKKGELNTTVTPGKLFMEVGPKKKLVDVSHLGQGIYRVEDEKALAVVGPKFTPLQNNDVANFFRPWVEARLAYIEAAGSLDEGRRMWMLAKINIPNIEIVKGDALARFVLLSNAHDGTLAVRVGFTDIRTVCANTLAEAYRSEASKLIRIRHSKGVKQKVEDLREVMNLANREFEATAEQYKLLARKSYNQKDIKKFVNKMFEVEGKPLDEISTKTKNQMDKVYNLIETGMGNDLPGVKGTLWQMYNGYTQYLTYERGHTDASRLNSLWFGDSAKRNREALELCLALAV